MPTGSSIPESGSGSAIGIGAGRQEGKAHPQLATTSTTSPAVITQARTTPVGPISLRPRRTPLGDAWRTLRRQPVAMAGLTIILGWLLLGLLAPVLPLDDPLTPQSGNNLQEPSRDHWLGTDELGRDMLSRVIYGARISLPSGVLVILATGSFGCLIGAVAGYVGGWVDNAIMRFADAVLSFPSIILAMTITAVSSGLPWGQNRLLNALLAVGLVLWPEYARVMRGQVLSIKTNEYVTAAQSVGASSWRVLTRHILPSTDAPIIVKATLDVGAAIVLTASLSFIGLGVVPPTPEWGAMINQGFKKGIEFWWMSSVPGIAIMSVVMALNFFGDGLRDALDPRRRGR